MTEQFDDTAVLDEQRTPPAGDHDELDARDAGEDKEVPEEARETLHWLEDEFPEWDIEVGVGQTLNRENIRLWVARREGHHPQSEQSAGKLYSRLTEYEEREEQRFPSPN